MNTHEMGTTHKNPENVRVGRTLHAFRERFGYTQDQLATEVGMSQGHLANIEAGRKALSNRHLSKIADLLGITPLAIKQFDRELVGA